MKSERKLKRRSITLTVVVLLSLLALPSCSSKQPVARTEVRAVPRLEFTPVPANSTEPCLIPMPPQDQKGQVPIDKGYVDWTVGVLGILEECNIKLEELRRLMKESDEGEGRGD